MKIFVGLGNPGAQYARNRHNIGFMAVERLAADHGFSPWRAKFQGQACEGTLAGEKLILLKPGTFMNLSGQSVGEAMRFFRLAPADIVVFHDELDLAPGKVRVKSGGGHAGHNGLRSIHAHIGDGYDRVRLGIGHPGHKDRVSAYVLSDFAKAEQDWLDEVLRGVSDGAAALAAGDGTRFMNAVALRTAPPRDAPPRDAPPRDAPPRDAPPKVASPKVAPPKPPEPPARGETGAAASPPQPPPQSRSEPEPPPDDTPQGLLRRLAGKFR